MNNATLQLAVDASKMLLLLDNGIMNPAETSRLRARVEEAVYALVRMGQLNIDDREKTALERFVADLHEGMVKEMGGLKIHALVTESTSYSLSNVLVNPKERAHAQAMGGRLLSTFVLPRVPGFEALDKKAGVNPALKGSIAHVFGSIVRNDEWMSLMLRLNADKPVKLNTQLMAEYSSGQGRVQRAEKVAQLITDKKVATKTKAQATGVLTVAVALTTKVVVQHPKVAPLFSALMVDSSNSDEVNKLINDATRVEEVALGDVQAFVQKRLDALVKGLAAQQKAHQVQVQERVAQAAKKKEDDAVKALKDMGPHLAVLASNPELLARALEQAGLAAPKAAATTGAKVVKAKAMPARRTPVRAKAVKA